MTGYVYIAEGFFRVSYVSQITMSEVVRVDLSTQRAYGRSSLSTLTWKQQNKERTWKLHRSVVMLRVGQPSRQPNLARSQPRVEGCCLPSPRAKVQERQFMKPSLESLTTCPAPTMECRPQLKRRAPLPRGQHTARPASPAFVDLPDDDDDGHEVLPSQSMKRTHA